MRWKDFLFLFFIFWWETKNCIERKKEISTKKDEKSFNKTRQVGPPTPPKIWWKDASESYDLTLPDHLWPFLAFKIL